MRPLPNAIHAGRGAAVRGSSGVIIADDLTGAADACVAFVIRGLSGAVMFDADDAPVSPSAAPDTSVDAADVIAISTDSRALPPPLAAERVGAAVRRYVARAACGQAHVQSGQSAAPWLFKKIDSTLRGPVGAEIHAAMSAAHASVAIVAPAFPAMGRIVDRGLLRTTGRGAPPAADIVQRLREEGIDDCVSVMRPVTRAAASAAGANHAESLRDAQTLRARWRDALSSARRRGARLLVCDSLDQADLDAIVAGAHQAAVADDALHGPILWAGAAGLAHALARHVTGLCRDVADDREAVPGLEWSDVVGRRRDARTTSIVFAIGSTHPVTVAQQQRVMRDALPIATASVDDAQAIRQALDLRLDVMVTMPYDAGDAAVAGFVGLLIARQQAAPGSCALVMSGGDTAARLCRELGAARISLGGEVATGIPWGTLSLAASPGHRSEVGFPVVLKAGGFGADDGLMRVRQFLMEKHERSC